MVRGYIPNPNFEKEFLASDEALEIVTPIAEAGAEVARGRAPRAKGFIVGDIKAETGVVDGVATGRINSHDFKSWWHEAGTRHHAATPFLRPALEQITGKPLKGSP